MSSGPGARRLGTALACAAMALLGGCSGASAPESADGVRAMYRAIGLDAGAGDFPDICRSYMDPALGARTARTNHDCTTSSSTSTLERWAEKVRLAKVTTATRIALSRSEALVYDGAKPERVLYAGGQWRLAEVPELSVAGRGSAR